MPHIAKLTEDLDALRTEMGLNWRLLHARPLEQEERRKLRVCAAMCQAELKRLLEELDRMPDAPPPSVQ